MRIYSKHFKAIIRHFEGRDFQLTDTCLNDNRVQIYFLEFDDYEVVAVKVKYDETDDELFSKVEVVG